MNLKWNGNFKPDKLTGKATCHVKHSVDSADHTSGSLKPYTPNYRGDIDSGS